MENRIKIYFTNSFFLYYPYSIYSSLQQKIQKWAIAINATIIPVLYLVFGQFQGQLLYLGKQALTNETYNSYLSISDTLLFNSLFFLAIASQSIYAILINLISTILLFLIGSRIALVFSVIAFILIVFENLNFALNKIALILMLKTKKIMLNKKVIPIFLIALSFLLLSFYLNIFSIQSLAISYISSIRENILDSRVWQSIFGDYSYIYISNDNSLNTRLELFQCHISLFFSSAKTLFLGTKLENGNIICGNYLHSSLSVITEFGFLSLFFISIVYICLRRISKFFIYIIKRKSYRNIFIFMILFLIHGLVARSGVTYYLPALVFCYSITLRFNGIAKNNNNNFKYRSQE